MSSVSSTIASFLVNALWEIPLFAGAGWLAGRCVKKLGAEVEHFVWISTLAVAALVPAIPLLRQLLILPNALQTHSENSLVTLIAAQNPELNSRGALILPGILVVSLVSVYLALLTYFVVRFLWSFYRTSKLVQNARAASLTPRQEEIWFSCKQAYSLATTQILSSREVSGPVTLGWREPVMLLPEDFSSSCSEQDFLAALAHECAHVKRRDFQKNILYEAVTLLFAFHPAIWMIKSRIAQTREMICDRMATEDLIDSRSYVQSLLRLAAAIAANSRLSTSHAIGIFDADILEKRIMTIKIKKQPIGAGMRYGLILPATLALLLAGAGGVAMAVVIEPAGDSQAAVQGKPYGQVYRVGKDVSAPTIVSTPEAKFPKNAPKAKDFDKTCVVGLVVDVTGMPRDVHMVRSISPEFDASAMTAVKQYRFTPGKRQGIAVATAVNVEVRFKRY